MPTVVGPSIRPVTLMITKYSAVTWLRISPGVTFMSPAEPAVVTLAMPIRFIATNTKARLPSGINGAIA